MRSISIILALCSCLGSVAVADKGDPENIERKLLEVPLYQTLKSHEPEQYQLILKQFKGIHAKGGSLTDLHNEVRPTLQRVLEKRMPYGSNNALREFARLILEQSSVLYNINPEMCDIYLGAYLNESIDPQDIASYFTSELAQKEMDVITSVILSSYNNNISYIDENKMEQLRLMVFDKVSAQHQNAGKVLTDVEYAIDNIGSFCVVNQALYKAMLELPEQQSGNLIRYIFSE